MEYSTETVYMGQGRCTTVHKVTGATVTTDLDKSHGGLEQNPSPGELLGATLASCMMSMVSFIASRKEIDVKGMKFEAFPVAENGKITKIVLKATVPLPANHPYRKALEQSALTCPVHGVLRADIETPIEWNWIG
ncbi:MAG: OsmC family protein [Akkermansia sp.]